MNKDIHFPEEIIDKVIHEPARFKIMVILSMVENADFIYLLHKTNLSKGNLSSHLKKLEEVEYVEITKEFVDKTPRTLMCLTDNGNKALSEYKETLLSLLDLID